MTRREHPLTVRGKRYGLSTLRMPEGPDFLAAVRIPQKDRILPGIAHPHTALLPER